jgi:hypothetical protein
MRGRLARLVFMKSFWERGELSNRGVYDGVFYLAENVS